MVASIEKISQEVVDLSPRERVALMRILLELDRPSTGNEVDQTWDQEIRARIKAVDEGRAIGIPYDQFKQEMTRRFGNR